MDEEKKIVEGGHSYGYANCTYWGTYSGPVTREDIEKMYFHEFFGGRLERFDNGKFRVVRYVD